MANNDNRFFTNEPGASLLNRFKKNEAYRCILDLEVTPEIEAKSKLYVKSIY